MLVEFDTPHFPAASTPIPDFDTAQKDADRITEVYSLPARTQLCIFSCAHTLLTLEPTRLPRLLPMKVWQPRIGPTALDGGHLLSSNRLSAARIMSGYWLDRQ